MDVVNLKCEPDLIPNLINEKGIYPAYHMNKKHWCTIYLDGTVGLEEIYKLIDISYELAEK
mgnify:CR=1 FL=1